MKEFKYKINGNEYKVTVGEINDNIAHLEVNGTPYEVEMEEAPKPEPVKPVVRPVAAAQPAPAASAAPARPAAGKGGVKSPLPGVILDVKVNVGDAVAKGDLLLILEAMKMENSIVADRDGKVTAINVKNGDSVLEGTDLVIIE